MPESQFCDFQDDHFKYSDRNMLLYCVISFDFFYREFDLSAKELPMLPFLSVKTTLIIFTIYYKLP